MSTLAKLYALLIRKKIRTIKDVPEYLKKEVEELLKAE